MSAIAPARSKARAESILQLVPGNTGISTFGLAPREVLRGFAVLIVNVSYHFTSTGFLLQWEYIG